MAAPGRHGLAYVVIIHVFGNVSMSSQKLALSSKNFSMFLTWAPPVDHPPESLYKVEIKPEDVWLQTTNCAFPSEEDCDVTCTIKNCYSPYKARVGNILPESPVVWNLSNEFTPFYDVELGAPQMSVALVEESITVNLQIKLRHCKEMLLKACLLETLTYEVEIWDEDEHIKRPIKQNVIGNSLEIRKSELRGNNNCIAARSINKSLKKSSDFSKPYCFRLKQEVLQTKMYLAIMGSALGVLFLISIAVAIMKKMLTSSVKMPAALDFTSSTLFIPVADAHPDVCKLSVVTCCDKSEADVSEQNIILEGNLTKETNFLDIADCTDESDEESEYSGYTDRRWIPDGVMLDQDETLNDQRQAPIAKAYQKANCFDDSIIGAVELQDQQSGCIDHNRPQTKFFVDVSNPVSINSDVRHSKHFSDCMSFVVLDHDEQSSNADVPLISVKVLCFNSANDNYSNAGDDEDDDLLSSNASLCDLNFRTYELAYRPPTLLGELPKGN
ncbi:interferon lambda receptor 1-like [Scyliorhinus canicula]|uniref:interferon lambda receptor 1-like n=1 Tax=Scyliorhinus canicula TaxID=7830 RepID=UPI0018F6AFB7|nr:interferon lambda receptor 1-like [Scyliorhinus canicula]